MHQTPAKALLIATFIGMTATQAQASCIVHSIEPSPPGGAAAIYVEATGELVFSIGSGVPLLGISAPGLLKQGLTPTLGAKPPDLYDASGLAYFDFRKPLPEGIFSQGPLFDAGLDYQFVVDNIAFNYEVPGADVFAFICYLPVPEPNCGFLFAAALAGICCFRRRPWWTALHSTKSPTGQQWVRHTPVTKVSVGQHHVHPVGV